MPVGMASRDVQADVMTFRPGQADPFAGAFACQAWQARELSTVEILPRQPSSFHKTG